MLFSIQSKLRANNRKLYIPREGRSISDINKVGCGVVSVSHGCWGGAIGEPSGPVLSASPARLICRVCVCPSLSCAQAWTRLEKAEHEREVALRNELIRQEKLERLAQRFDHKVAMRETWLNENQRLVSQVG